MALSGYPNCKLDIWGEGLCPGQSQRSPYAPSCAEQMSPVKQTLSPTVTGTSVLGIAVKDGIVLAADMLGSYGSLARYKSCSRVMKVNESTVLAAGGDYADFQYLQTIIEQRVNDENCYDDGFNYNPRSLFSWLTRVMYNRRSKYDPLWNVFAIGGMHEGKPFLGYVDKIGIAYTSDTIASGFGSYIALPILRNAIEKNPQMNIKEAKEVIAKCMKILFYRDARSLDKFEMVTVTNEGASVEGPISVQADWSIARLITGYE
ncbi:proteasome subunit beta type-4-like [Argonauta hians]